MNLAYDDGRTLTKPYDKEEFDKAVEDPHCVSATIFKPGTIVKMSDRSYRVGPNGNLIRMKTGG